MKTIFEKTSGAGGIYVGNVEKNTSFKPLEQIIPESMLRKEPIGLPQLTELEVMRHYLHKSPQHRWFFQILFSFSCSCFNNSFLIFSKAFCIILEILD